MRFCGLVLAMLSVIIDCGPNVIVRRGSLVTLDPSNEGLSAHKHMAAEAYGRNRWAIMDAAADHVRDVSLRAMEFRNGLQREEAEIIERRVIGRHNFKRRLSRR